MNTQYAVGLQQYYIYYEFNYYTTKWIEIVSYSIKVVWVQVKVAINKIENTLFYASHLINQNSSQIKSFDLLLKKSEPYDKSFDKSFMTTEVKD